MSICPHPRERRSGRRVLILNDPRAWRRVFSFLFNRKLRHGTEVRMCYDKTTEAINIFRTSTGLAKMLFYFLAKNQTCKLCKLENIVACRFVI